MSVQLPGTTAMTMLPVLTWMDILAVIAILVLKDLESIAQVSF